MTDERDKIANILHDHWKYNNSHIGDTADAILAALSDAQCVEVKPLEWVESCDKNFVSGSYEVYRIETSRNRNIWRLVFNCEYLSDFGGATACADAKAAAQAHHAAKITAAINTRTVAEVRGGENGRGAWL